jgi:hypothetical protein
MFVVTCQGGFDRQAAIPARFPRKRAAKRGACALIWESVGSKLSQSGKPDGIFGKDKEETGERTTLH